MGYGGVAIQRTWRARRPPGPLRSPRDDSDASTPAWRSYGLAGSFGNQSESFFRAPRGFKKRSIAFRKFQPFSQNPELSMAYGRAAAKKSPTAPWGGHGVARRQGGRAHARVCPPGPLRIPLARLVLVHPGSRLPPPDLLCRGPQSPCECPAQPTRRPLAAWRTYSERSLSGGQEKCSILDSSQSWGYRRLAHFPPPSSEAPGAEGDGPSKACPEPAEGGAPVGADSRSLERPPSARSAQALRGSCFATAPQDEEGVGSYSPRNPAEFLNSREALAAEIMIYGIFMLYRRSPPPGASES
jgi:hypothetical protein